MKNALSLTLTLATVAGVVWLFTLDTGRDAATGERSRYSPAPPPAGPTPELAVAAERAPERRSTDDGRPPSLRDVLKDFWGDRYGEVADRMREIGRDLDEPYRLSPWEEVRERARQEMALKPVVRDSYVNSLSSWTDEPTVEWAADELDLELEEYQLPELVAVAEPLNLHLRDLATRYVDGLESGVLDRFDDGRMVRVPVTTKIVPLEPFEEGTRFYSSAAATGGWAFRISLTSESCPEMVALLEEIHELRDRRQEALEAHFGR